MRIGLTVLLLIAPAATSLGDEAPKVIDITPVKAQVHVVTDGKGHYIVINPAALSDEFFFYGDGKTMWSQRTGSGGRNGDAFSRSFWEPRARDGWQKAFDYSLDKKFSVQCGDRNTEMKPVSDAEKQKILDGAKFYAPRWRHQAYALARDNTGKYFYVDKLREPPDSKVFRVWSGMKGAMKLEKLTNIVNDSEGDIFATKTGSLRVVLDKHESMWSQGKKQLKLVVLPIEDNAALIYTDLGVYTGQPLGTPCDDL
jgi:hypothetical protein